jgi:hypothetical protein
VVQHGPSISTRAGTKFVGEVLSEYLKSDGKGRTLNVFFEIGSEPGNFLRRRCLKWDLAVSEILQESR